MIAPPADGPTPKPAAGETRYPAVAVTVGVPVGPVRAALARLGAVLAGLSVAVWLLAAVAGRAVCRRALRPLTRMAEAARGMSVDEPRVRLPVGPAADEPGELGRAFNGLLDRLNEAHERQRRFTAEASHQLRTPLAAMLGQVEVALRRDRPADEYRLALEAVRSQAGRLRQVTDALLFLARSDADAGPPTREPVDLGAWLRDQLTVWADHPRAADLKLIPEAAGPVTVAVHPVMLGEVVNNLIDNALKYSQPGTPVTVGFGNCWVAVEDVGCGIDPADRTYLFQPFYRSADARRLGVPGLGLGLAIAGRLAAALGATVDVSSAVGRGSRFTIRWL
ncbi:MAG: ATP-binding protein [Gemmataceae bacterium]